MNQPSPDYQIVIAPGGVEQNYWRDLWRYRELFQVLAWRDVAIRYKQTAIGIAWAVVPALLLWLLPGRARCRQRVLRGRHRS